MNRNSNRCIRLPGNKSPIPMKTFSSLKKQKRSNTPEMHQKQVKSAQPWVCTRRNRNQSKLLFNLEQSVFIHSKTNPRSSIYGTHQVAIHTRKRNVYVEPIALLTASGQTVLGIFHSKENISASCLQDGSLSLTSHHNWMPHSRSRTIRMTLQLMY